MFYADPFFISFNSRFCSSESSTLLPCCTVPRLGKWPTAPSCRHCASVGAAVQPTQSCHRHTVALPPPPPLPCYQSCRCHAAARLRLPPPPPRHAAALSATATARVTKLPPLQCRRQAAAVSMLPPSCRRRRHRHHADVLRHCSRRCAAGVFKVTSKIMTWHI